MDLSFLFLKKTNFSSFLLNFEHNKPKKKLGCSGDVNLGDVSQLWTSLGLERHRLDDLLELVSIATTTPPSTKDEEGGQDLETEENVGACGDGKAETGGAKETRSYDPATIVDWNKLLALAAGQLGDVNTRLFFTFLFLIQSLYSYQSASNPTTHAEDSIKTFAHHRRPFQNLLADGPTAAPDDSSSIPLLLHIPSYISFNPWVC